MKDSVLRAQGRFGALHHPPPSLACRRAHKQEVADDRDRQPGLHRLPQRRYTGMPDIRLVSHADVSARVRPKHAFPEAAGPAERTEATLRERLVCLTWSRPKRWQVGIG